MASFDTLGDQEVKNLSFTIPAGGTLVGGRLEFVATTADSFAFGNVVIDTRLVLTADTQFIGSGDSVDLDDLDISINNAAGDPVVGTKQYTVKTFAGTDVTLDGSTFAPENDTGYTVTVSVNGETAAGTATIVCRDERTDSEGRILYADFGNTADVNPDTLDSYLFDISYTGNTMYYAIGWQGSKYGLCKFWDVQTTTWSYTFLSDGYADFTNGGTVTFDTTEVGNGGAYSVYWYPADGERVTVAELTGVASDVVNTLSFTVPAGGTLVGGRLEFVAAKVDDTFTFGNVVIDTRLVLTADTQFVGSGDSVDLDDLDISINNAAGDPVVGTKQYTVKTFAGTDVTLDGSTFAPENDTGYTVTVSVNGETAAGTATIVCRDERTDGEGRIIYADFGNTADGTPDTLDSYLFAPSYTSDVMYYAIGWQGAKYGLCKFYTVGLSTWSYTFLSDGYADFTNGGTVSFDAVIAAATGAYTAYYYPADGGERITVASFDALGDQEVKNLSFTIPAGGTLVGGRLEFVATTADSFVFGNVVIAENAAA